MDVIPILQSPGVTIYFPSQWSTSQKLRWMRDRAAFDPFQTAGLNIVLDVVEDWFARTEDRMDALENRLDSASIQL
jgi:hypothetical protein